MSDAITAINLESLIKKYISDIEKTRTQLKELKDMVNSALENDSDYHNKLEEIKELNRHKNTIRQKLIKEPSLANTLEKIRGLQEDLKEMQEALSKYLIKYEAASGATHIEGEDGKLRQIVHNVKLTTVFERK